MIGVITLLQQHPLAHFGIHMGNPFIGKQRHQGKTFPAHEPAALDHGDPAGIIQCLLHVTDLGQDKTKTVDLAHRHILPVVIQQKGRLTVWLLLDMNIILAVNQILIDTIGDNNGFQHHILAKFGVITNLSPDGKILHNLDDARPAQGVAWPGLFLPEILSLVHLRHKSEHRLPHG